MSNPIRDIDDVDDDLFVSKKPSKYIFAEQKKAQDISEKTSRMMLNSRALVAESEKVGQAALENLYTQREQLEKVENDLDTINTMTRSTQKHLNNMRSFFGGIKSLFSSSSSNSNQNNGQAIMNSGMTKSATIADMSTTGGNAASANTASASTYSHPPVPSSQRIRHPAHQASTSALNKISEPVDEFESNLGELSFGIGILKDMATKMGDEIGNQNQMLDRITDKSERAGDSIKLQNRQMQQMLKK